MKRSKQESKTEEEKEEEEKRKKRQLAAEKNHKCKACCNKTLAIVTFKGMFAGISFFEIINVLMIIFSFCTMGLKYYYDSVVWTKVLEATSQSSTNVYLNQFVDFGQEYMMYESLSLLDCLVTFMMSLSIIKYTFFWIPSLRVLTQSFRTYFNQTIKRIFFFIILVSMMFSLYCHYFYSYVCYGFFDLSFAMIRTNLLFIQGSLFNVN